MKKQLTPEEFLKIARNVPRDERVPYAFEKRVMAHLAASAPDALLFWTRALWRAVVPCVGVTLIVAAVSFSLPQPSNPDPDLDLDSVVLTPPDAALDLTV